MKNILLPPQPPFYPLRSPQQRPQGHPAKSKFLAVMKSKTTILSTLIGLGLTGASSAAISLVDNSSGIFTTTSNTATVSGLDLNDTTNVFVVAVYIDADNSTYSATFGGAAASGFINKGSSRMGSFYWMNPETAAGQNLVIGGNNGKGAYQALQLTGVDTSVTAIMSGLTAANSNTTTITTTSANSFITSFYSENGNNDRVHTPGNSFTKAGVTQNISSGGGSISSATFTLATAGTQTTGWSSSSNGSNEGVAAFAFAPIPEPSSTALLGMGGLALILRRRR